MSTGNNGFKFLSINYLYEGLVLDEDVYDSEGILTLLRKNTALTANHIIRLKQLKGMNQNIRVSAAMHKKLIENGLPKVFEQKYLEDSLGYTQVEKGTSDMFKNVEKSGSVSYDQASELSDSLSKTVTQADPALIFQCINGYNEVDEYLYRHSVNVPLINALMGKWLNLPQEEISLLVIGGLMHDIGKTMVPQEILNANRRLTDEEYEIIKKHATYSYELISKDKNFNEAVCKIALHHHEKMNGSGYPSKLVADQIPLYARITSISDIYDAMVSQRVYKKANSPFKILADLAEQKFSDLDMKLVELFTRMMPIELTGKSVLMTDGSVATVRHVDINDMEYPYVEMNKQILKTNDEFNCISMIHDGAEIDFNLHLTNIHKA